MSHLGPELLPPCMEYYGELFHLPPFTVIELHRRYDACEANSSI